MKRRRKHQPVRGPKFEPCAQCEHSPGWVKVIQWTHASYHEVVKRCPCWTAFQQQREQKAGAA